MKSLEQMPASLIEKNGQVVAKQGFGKTDVRYWQDVIFKPTYRRDGKTFSVDDWAARIQWRGRRELFNLRTPNKAAAAARAREIYLMLVASGWEPTLVKFKPEMQRKSISTIGDLLNELRSHWAGKPKTFEDYCRSFRRIVSEAFKLNGGREKFDYVNGGRDAWVSRIDAIKLAEVTPERINKWRIGFVRRAGSSPAKQRRARITCNSMMRQAKSLFSAELLAHVKMHRPSQSPFDTVAFYERESMRYHSTLDIETLVADAIEELPQESLKIFLLATMAGLRRNEIDKLEYSAFRWNENVIQILATEHFEPKTKDSGGDVPIDPELTAMFRGWHAKAQSPFVIEADSEPRTGMTYTHYRAQKHFDRLTTWLRSKGVTASKPLHELRKEFGSQICAKYGIYAASRMLRHTDIAITADHYLDSKERVTVGMGKLLPLAENITPISEAGSVSEARRLGRT